MRVQPHATRFFCLLFLALLSQTDYSSTLLYRFFLMTNDLNDHNDHKCCNCPNSPHDQTPSWPFHYLSFTKVAKRFQLCKFSSKKLRIYPSSFLWHKVVCIYCTGCYGQLQRFRKMLFANRVFYECYSRAAFFYECYSRAAFFYECYSRIAFSMDLSEIVPTCWWR